MLYSAGWIPSWFRSKLANFDDTLLEAQELPTVALTLAVLWFAMEQHRHSGSRSLFNHFTAVGITKKVAGYLSWILTPLANDCYTTDQLVIKGFEHILGSQT
jgi:hypothetical protein